MILTPLESFGDGRRRKGVYFFPTNKNGVTVNSMSLMVFLEI